MATEIASLFAKIGADIAGFESGMKKAEGGLEGLKTNLTSLGGMATKAFAAAGVAVAAGFTASVGYAMKSTHDWANQLDSLSDVLGTTAQESAALAVLFEGVGGNVDNLTGQMTFFARGLQTAKGELGPVGLELQKLGINVQDANGELLDAPTILSRVADQFAAMPDSIGKSAQMTRIFGRSGRDLSDVMNALAKGGLAEADKKAQALGLTLSDKTVSSVINIDKKIADFNLTLKGFATQIGTALVPVVLPALEGFNKILMKLSTEGGAKFVEIGDRINTMMGRFNELVGEGNLSGAIAELTSGFMEWAGAGKETSNQLGNIVGNLAVGDWQAALDTGLQPLIDSLSSWVEKSLPGLMTNLGKWLGQLTGWIISTAIPTLIAWTAEMAGRFVQWLIDVTPRLAEQLALLGLSLAEELNKVWTDTIDPGLRAWWEGVVTWGTKIGASLVEGMKAGIAEKADALIDWLTNFFRNLIKIAKAAVGFGSPAKEFIKIGRASMEGYQLGFENAARRSPIDVAGSLVGGHTAGGGSQTVTANFYSMLPYDILQARRQLRGLVR